MPLKFRFALFSLFLTITVLSSIYGQTETPSGGKVADSRENGLITDPNKVTSAVNPAARAVPLDDLYFSRNVSNPAWSPDGKEIVFTTNLSGRPNLWKMSASGGFPIQLTQSENRQYNAVWSPDGKWIIFNQDYGGNEMPDLFAVPSNGGESINLTNTPDVSESWAQWSPDGKMLAFVYRSKTSSARNLALIDWQTKKIRQLTFEETPDHQWGVIFIGWSPDSKTIYSNRFTQNLRDSNVYKIDVAGGKSENLTPHDGEIYNFASSLSPDGKRLLLTSDGNNGYRNVALLDIASRKFSWVTNVKWEAQSGDFSPDGESFTYEINEDGRTDAYLGRIVGSRNEKLPLPTGLNTFALGSKHFSAQGDRLIISHESSRQPADIWVYDIKTRRARQITFSAVASLSAATIPPSQIIHYRSFDGKIISAFLWIPANLKRDKSNAAVVILHGGPTSQTLDSWNPDVTALVLRGYICIAPNYRGSTGYGAEFRRANYQDLGGGDLQDVVYAARFLSDTGYADSQKIGITGGSYGGALTLMALGKTPELWAAGVDLFGVIDWSAMLKHSTPVLQQYIKGLLGDPDKDRQVYEKSSAITYIQNVKAPLLVLQGENDPRVPKAETEQVVNLLRKDGKVVDVHYYPEEGHGFVKRENQIDSIKRTLEWFDRHLKKSKL